MKKFIMIIGMGLNVKVLMCFSIIISVSCNTNNNGINNKDVKIKNDTVVISGKLNDKPIQGFFLIDSGSFINFIDILDKFKDTSYTGSYRLDSKSLLGKKVILDSITISYYHKYNQDYTIYNYSSIGSIYIIRDDFGGEEYFIKYHPALDSILLDLIVQYLKADYIKRKKEMFPVIPLKTKTQPRQP